MEVATPRNEAFDVKVDAKDGTVSSRASPTTMIDRR